ncbi:phage terminase small subunit [Pseudomonas sp. LB3P31]
MSLALAHKRRILAEGPAAARADAESVAYSSATALSSPANAKKHLKLMEDAMAQDLERLSSMDNHGLRQLLKRDELLPKYLDYVQRYRDSGLSFPNSVVMQVLVWLFDTEQFEAGFDLAGFAMEQGQAMPERFKRNVQTFVADAVIDWAEAEYKAKRSPEPYLTNLLPLVDGEWKLFDRIPARYHKQIGILALDQRDFAKAITHFERAEALYEGIGVGTRLEGARKALTKEQAQQPPADTAAE